VGRTFAYVIDGYSLATTKPMLHVLDVASDGALSPAVPSTHALGAKPLALNSNAAGSRLYVTSRETSSLYTLSIDPESGALVQLDQDSVGAYPDMVALHPNGRWLYVSDWSGSPRIDGFELDDNGVPSPMAGSPFTFPGISAIWIEIHPNGQWAYVVDNVSSEVHAMAISSTTGALSPLGVPGWDSFDSGAYAALIDATGRFGFIAFDYNSRFPAFTIDPATGAMSTTPGSPFDYTGANTCMNATMDRTRQRVFIADDGSGDNTLGAFRVDTSTGAPVPLLNSPYPTPDIMWSVAASPSSDDVYTTTSGSSPAILHFRADNTALLKIGEYTFPGLDRATRLALVHPLP
jgi:6-phosphogluconolactonase (cycloisomerase 2 family)